MRRLHRASGRTTSSQNDSGNLCLPRALTVRLLLPRLLLQGALSSAEIALRQEREARQKLEAQLAKEVADRKELATRVVEACVAGEGKLVGRRR